MILVVVGIITVVISFWLWKFFHPQHPAWVKDMPGPVMRYPKLVQTIMLGVSEEWKERLIVPHRANPGFAVFYQLSLQEPQVSILDADLLPLVATVRESYRQHALHRHEEKIFGPSIAEQHFVFTADGNTPEWRMKRSVFGPAFRLGSLQRVCPLIYERAQALVTKWQNLAQENGGSASVIALKEISGLSIDVIAAALFGQHFGAVEDNKQELMQAYLTFTWNFLLRIMLGKLMDVKWVEWLLQPKLAYFSAKMRGLVADIVNKRVASKVNESESGEGSEEQQETTAPRDVLDYMISKHKFTPEEIINELVALIFPGFDSTANTLAFAIYYLTSNAEVRNKVVEEVEREWAGVNAENITIEDVNKLEYTRCVILEVLRKHPLAIAFMRRMSKDVVLDGKTVPAGTCFQISMLDIHHNEKHWANPNTFNPDRFLPANNPPMHAFLPFAVGNHVCLGEHLAMLEAKIALALLIKSFTFQLPADYVFAEVKTPILSPKGGLPVIVTPTKHTL